MDAMDAHRWASWGAAPATLAVVAQFFEDGAAEYGWHGRMDAPLAEMTDPLWTDYCVRRGHAILRRTSWRVESLVPPTWRRYAVYLLPAGEPLDRFRTPREQGLVPGRLARVRLVRA